MKTLENIPEGGDLSKDYLLAFGSVSHYLKRIAEYHESRKTSEPLPTRWLHLAERSLLHRPLLKYAEYFTPSELDALGLKPDAKTRLSKVDELVDHMNALLGQPGITSSLRENESLQLKQLSELYESVRQLVVARS